MKYAVYIAVPPGDDCDRIARGARAVAPARALEIYALGRRESGLKPDPTARASLER
ncbi:MAG TPA: hypothetical protein VLK37_08610 [Solirubrobacterales bacterium]|nr:hypothetical protein [Solirubrobacterales bacterium]